MSCLCTIDRLNWRVCSDDCGLSAHFCFVLSCVLLGMRLYIADSSGGLSGIVLRWYRRFLVCVIFLQSVHLSGFLCICLSFTYFSHFIYLFIYLFIIHLTTPSLSDCVLCMLYTSMSLRYQVQWVGLMIPVTLVAHHVPSLTSGTEWVNTGSAVCYCES